MSAPRIQRSFRPAKSAPIKQLASHAHLLNDASRAPTPSEILRQGPLDAIIVPTARPVSALTGLLELAARLNIVVVALCSLHANYTRVATRMERTGVRGIAIDLDDDYTLPLQLTYGTSSDAFYKANGERCSDLSVKRNVGLLLAKLRGWNKIAFVDDDITLTTSDFGRIADQLDDNQIAGMMCRQFPDNSVLCHARRLAELPQDVFVTGAVLGVNCSDLPLPFFPDIYNEDWFFFAEAAAHHRLVKVGEARQDPYDPYVASRACHEEFGDLLAEGLYSTIEGVCGSSRRPGDFYSRITNWATERYWSTFIDVRRQDIETTRAHLEKIRLQDDCSDKIPAAITALHAADALYDSAINAEGCAAFLDAWADDMTAWNAIYARIGNVTSTEDAMDWLEIKRWIPVR